MNPFFYRVVESHITDMGNRHYRLSPRGLEDPDCHIVTVIRYAGDRPSELEDGDIKGVILFEMQAVNDPDDIEIALEGC